jgi:hypothetical protein
MRVGIKRRAIVIIIANSWAGRPNLVKGFKRASIPSVKIMGEVVRVKSDVPIIRRVNLTAINPACLKPSSVIFMKPNEKTTLPGVIKRLIKKVTKMMNKIGLKPFITNLRGTFEIVITTVRNAATIKKPTKLSIKNKDMIKIMVNIIFSLGSRL